MGKISRDKGKRGEREVAQIARMYGIGARRGQQYAGGGDSPDVILDVPGWHPEVKRTERFHLYDALTQAKEDRNPGNWPVVFHRSNNKPWVAIVEIEVFFRLISEHFKNGNSNPVPPAVEAESEVCDVWPPTARRKGSG